MKLYGSPTSPYTRKVHAVALELGLELTLERVDVYSMTSDFGAVNPMHRIPALGLDDGEILFDSRVICEYLASERRPTLLASAGVERWKTLRLQALGDGIMDAAVPWFGELSRPPEQQSPARLSRYERCVVQSVHALEQRVAELDGVNLGTLSVACALGYLHFRFQALDWRRGQLRLAKWARDFSARPSIALTLPTAVERWAS